MKKLVFIISLAIVAISCGEKKEQKSELTGSISIDGSGTVFPVSEAVAEEFLKVEPKVRVTVGESGTGGGFKKFGTGVIDVSAASRDIKSKEIELCKENGIEYLQLTVALDGITVVVNKENTWAKTMTTEELKKLWEPNSSVKKWSDIRAYWPNEEIHLYGPNTSHGTYDFFTEVIMGESGASRTDYNAVSDYNVAVQGIEKDVNALGYFGLSYYEENKDKLAKEKKFLLQKNKLKASVEAGFEEGLTQEQALAKSRFDLEKKSAAEREKFNLKLEQDRLNGILFRDKIFGKKVKNESSSRNTNNRSKNT